MPNWLSRDFNGTAFQLFGAPHLVALAIILAACIALSVSGKPRLPTALQHGLRSLLIVLLLGSQLSWDLWNLSVGLWHVSYSLPLHLCSLTQLLCAIMLITRSKAMFEVLYFWGLAGATQALLTPEIGIYGFPHIQFWAFFVAHGAILLAVLYMIAIEGLRPNWAALLKAWLAANLILPLIGLVNWLTGGNYWFVARKPATASLLDFLGPWPWYILSMQLVGLVCFVLCLLPFVLRRPRPDHALRSA